MGKKKNCKQRLKFHFKEMYFTFTFNDMKSFLFFITFQANRSKKEPFLYFYEKNESFNILHA